MNKIIYLPLALFLFSGCEKEVAFMPAERGELMESSLNGSLDAGEIEKRITELDPEDVVRYGVRFYSLTYRTEYQGKPVNSTGLLIIPEGVTEARLLMYCHGTEIPSRLLGSENIAPSPYKGSTDTHRDVRNMGLGWASAGYVVFLPDYIGFGLTADKDHPYIYFPELFKANIDGLLAAKSFLLSRTDLVYDQNLFITGWSQGGGACLSAHKYIQEQYGDEFRVVASSSLAGLSNVMWYVSQFIRSRGSNKLVLPILSWGVYAINKFSSLRRPTDQIYSYPVYDEMSSLIVPSLNPERVFNHLFMAGVITGSDTEVMSILEDNSYNKGWKPEGKVFLHHGDADDLVPIAVSQTVLEGLKNEGGDVTLYRYEGGKHDTELGNFIKNTLADFNLLK